MPDPRQEIERMLKEDGATLLRSKKHEIWKLSTGNHFTVSKTTSDNGWRNALSYLKKMLPHLVYQPDKAKEPRDTRKKKRQQEFRGFTFYSETAPPSGTKTFSAQLTKAVYPEKFERSERPYNPPTYELPPSAKSTAELAQDAGLGEIVREESRPSWRKRGYHQIGGSRTRHGPVVSLPPDVVEMANRCLNEGGFSAYQKFMQQYTKETRVPLSKSKEEEFLTMAGVKELKQSLDDKIARLEQLQKVAASIPEHIEKLKNFKAAAELFEDQLRNAQPSMLGADDLITALQPALAALGKPEKKAAHSDDHPRRRSPAVLPGILMLLEQNPLGLTSAEMMAQLRNKPGFEQVSYSGVRNAAVYNSGPEKEIVQRGERFLLRKFAAEASPENNQTQHHTA